MVNEISYAPPRYSEDAMRARAREYYQSLRTRRSVRDFRPDPVPEGVIEDVLRTAGSAPNGANLQPWFFSVVRSPELKRRIREAAEAEEREFYRSRAGEEWLECLAPLGTDDQKPFLETAPVLIAIFQRNRVEKPEGGERQTYYPKESVGIATGFLIAALHQAGLSTLTHTPSPMKFLNEILGRPAGDKPFLLLVVGYAAEGCTVPAISKKPLAEIAAFHD